MEIQILTLFGVAFASLIAWGLLMASVKFATLERP